jgi:hypothetical protein
LGIYKAFIFSKKNRSYHACGFFLVVVKYIKLK